jgi:hypothetical protein
VAAAVALLFAGLLLHFATPHHDVTISTTSATAPAVESESRKEHVSPRASPAHDHPCKTAHAIVRAPRAVAPVARPRRANDGPISYLAAPEPAQAPTPRHAWNPGAAAAPTPSTLQTFRC